MHANSGACRAQLTFDEGMSAASERGLERRLDHNKAKEKKRIAADLGILDLSSEKGLREISRVAR